MLAESFELMDAYNIDHGVPERTRGGIRQRPNCSPGSIAALDASPGWWTMSMT